VRSRCVRNKSKLIATIEAVNMPVVRRQDRANWMNDGLGSGKILANLHDEFSACMTIALTGGNRRAVHSCSA
jgi:hypothetical protein